MFTAARGASLRRALLVTFVASVTVAGVAGCVQREDSSAQKVADSVVPSSELSSVTLQVGDQKGVTQPLLEASGEIAKLPYKVNFSMFTSGPPQVEAAAADKIDFAVTGNTPPIFGAASNAKIRVVSAYAASGDGDQILVPKDSGITSVADLKGKKIAVAKGSSAHGNVLSQLIKAGLTTDDVTLVFLQPADALSAFTSGAVDAWAIWDPFTAIAQQQTGARTLTTYAQVGKSYGFGIASQAALADPKRNTAIADLVERIAVATKWAQDHPQEWAQKYATSLNIAPEVAEAAQQRSIRPAIELTDTVVSEQQTLTDAFYAAHQITTKPDFNAYVDRRYNSEIASFLGK